jgi:hypothetical protein
MKGKRERGPVFDDLDRAVRFEPDEAPYKWRYLCEESNAAVHGGTSVEEQMFLMFNPDDRKGAALAGTAASPAGESTAARLADLTWASVVRNWEGPTRPEDERAQLLLETVSCLADRVEAAFFAPAQAEFSEQDE